MARALQPQRIIAPEVLAKTKVDFDPEAFDAALFQHGNRFLWEKASPCPCRGGAGTERGNPACPVCYGDGWDYWGGQAVRCLAKALDLSAETQVAYGIWSAGMASVTLRGEHSVTFRDRLTNLDALIRFGEWRYRQAAEGETERLRYYVGAKTVQIHDTVTTPIFPPGDATDAVGQRAFDAETAARLQPIVTGDLSVLRLRLMDPATRTPGEVLYQGVDFEVVDGRIDWAAGDASGRAPAVPVGSAQGGMFAIDYYYHPRYLVVGFNHVARDQWIAKKRPEPQLFRLPIDVLAKLDYLRGPDGS